MNNHNIQRRRRRRSHRAGVTLVEVLIVVAIMALISGAAGFYVVKHYTTAQSKQAAMDARKIRAAAIIWRHLDNHNDECPTVTRLVEAGEIDDASDNLDPWGSDYQVECGAGVAVRSPGPDKRPATEDDILIGGHEG